MDIKIRSSTLLNVNVTFGMALSIRNILFEITDIVEAVDKQMKRIKTDMQQEIDELLR